MKTTATSRQAPATRCNNKSFACLAGVGVVATYCLMSSGVLALSNPPTSGDAAKTSVPTTQALDASPRTGSMLRRGDKLQIVFYEKLDDADDKWKGRAQAVPRGFHQRTELCGEYTVQDDGTISFPLLGRIDVANRTQDSLLETLGKSFDDLMERKGYVNIVGVEHQPIFVVGPVKTPGSFKFSPGMTVLHALALAGGLRQAEPEVWQNVENGREVERLQRSLERVKRLLARTSVLRDERDAPASAQPKMVSLSGVRAVKEVKDEEWQRSLAAMKRTTQENALKMALSNAQADLTARMGRIAPLDTLLALRNDRLKTLAQLVERSTVAKPVYVQSQTDVADVQDRREQALIEIEAAKKRVADAERDLKRFQVDSAVEINQATATAEHDTLDAVADSEGILNVIKALSPRDPSALGSTMKYEVVRRLDSGTVVLAMSDTSPLEPGDLVRVKTDDLGRTR